MRVRGETRSERAVLACACASTVLCDRAARSQGSGDSSETESADDDDAGAAAAGFQPFDRSSRMWQMLDQLEREETTALEARARKREQQALVPARLKEASAQSSTQQASHQ